MHECIIKKDPKGIYQIYINTEKKTVVAVFKPRPGRLLPKSYDADAYENDVTHWLSLGAECIEHRTFTGKAKCHPEDVFDRYVGINLAITRAYKNYLKAFARHLRCRKKLLLDALSETKEAIDTADLTIETLKREEDSLCEDGSSDE